jgi:hypothetical protein
LISFPGDFFKFWIQCRMECKKLVVTDNKNKVAMDILEGLEREQLELFKKPNFLAAIYMDPRFNFFGSSVLTSEQKKIAVVRKNKQQQIETN